MQEFRKVVVAYPRGSKVPTALYKEALALVDLKQTALAQARLQYLVDHFPQSEEAPLAKERLAALGRTELRLLVLLPGLKTQITVTSSSGLEYTITLRSGIGG